MRGCYRGLSNNGLHPTRISVDVIVNLALIMLNARRVMPGVHGAVLSMSELKNPGKEFIVILALVVAILVGCFLIGIGVVLYQYWDFDNVNVLR